MEPHTITFPKPYEHISCFERIIILRCIRPDKVVPAVQKFVLGKEKKERKKESFFKIAKRVRDTIFTKKKEKIRAFNSYMKRENKKKKKKIAEIEISLYEFSRREEIKRDTIHIRSYYPSDGNSNIKRNDLISGRANGTSVHRAAALRPDLFVRRFALLYSPHIRVDAWRRSHGDSTEIRGRPGFRDEPPLLPFIGSRARSDCRESHRRGGEERHLGRPPELSPCQKFYANVGKGVSVNRSDRPFQ